MEVIQDGNDQTHQNPQLMEYFMQVAARHNTEFKGEDLLLHGYIPMSDLKTLLRSMGYFEEQPSKELGDDKYFPTIPDDFSEKDTLTYKQFCACFDKPFNPNEQIRNIREALKSFQSHDVVSLQSVARALEKRFGKKETDELLKYLNMDGDVVVSKVVDQLMIK